jgi:hypothetical protein
MTNYQTVTARPTIDNAWTQHWELIIASGYTCPSLFSVYMAFTVNNHQVSVTPYPVLLALPTGVLAEVATFFGLGFLTPQTAYMVWTSAHVVINCLIVTLGGISRWNTCYRTSNV